MVHGTIDTLVPLGNARGFWDMLQARRKATPGHVNHDVFVELPNAHHAFNFVISPRSLWMGDAVVDFINHIYSLHQQKQQAKPAQQ